MMKSIHTNTGSATKFVVNFILRARRMVAVSKKAEATSFWLMNPAILFELLKFYFEILESIFRLKFGMSKNYVLKSIVRLKFQKPIF